MGKTQQPIATTRCACGAEVRTRLPIRSRIVPGVVASDPAPLTVLARCETCGAEHRLALIRG